MLLVHLRKPYQVGQLEFAGETIGIGLENKGLRG
jgi:hypothetical protein